MRRARFLPAGRGARRARDCYSRVPRFVGKCPRSGRDIRVAPQPVGLAGPESPGFRRDIARSEAKTHGRRTRLEILLRPRDNAAQPRPAPPGAPPVGGRRLWRCCCCTLQGSASTPKTNDSCMHLNPLRQAWTISLARSTKQGRPGRIGSILRSYYSVDWSRSSRSSTASRSAVSARIGGAWRNTSALGHSEPGRPFDQKSRVSNRSPEASGCITR